MGSSRLDVKALFSLIFLPPDVPELLSDAVERPEMKLKLKWFVIAEATINKAHLPSSMDPVWLHVSTSLHISHKPSFFIVDFY